ncbi:MAG: response regulator [Hyphomicrobiales bacterium]|jgi:two-component system chemotaxis response regulator CheY|nr:response regulator [Hyphomicrobiales bacterium]
MSFLDQLKVLIVDDTSTSRMLIRDGLEQLGIKNIIHAADGEQALKMMMSTPAHLVISDFNMPKLDGLQLLQAIRTYKPTAGVPFIMLTGKGDTTVLARGRALGLNNYLSKPVDMVALKKAIEGVVGRLR